MDKHSIHGGVEIHLIVLCDRLTLDEHQPDGPLGSHAYFTCTYMCIISSLTATSTGLEALPRPARPPTSEEVQAKLAAHAESLRKQAQDAASMLNLPSYLNPSVVNPHQYAVQAQKRKLLWSGKKTTEVCISSLSTLRQSESENRSLTLKTEEFKMISARSSSSNGKN